MNLGGVYSNSRILFQIKETSGGLSKISLFTTLQSPSYSPLSKMQTNTIRSRMEELRLICDKEISINQHRLETASLSFRKALESSKAKVQDTVQWQAKIGKLRALLREVEDDLVKALGVKNRKEAKKMTTADSIAATKARIEELKKFVADERGRKDEYAAIISHQYEVLAECEDKREKDAECRGEIEEAISWYNRVLGYRIECGRGVKFVFTNINPKNPAEEFSFTIRHENDMYTLLDCYPHVNDTKQLIQDLNLNNSLFKFVRTMRGKFQDAAACGIFPEITSHDQDSDTISLSAPVSSVSTDSRSESPAKQTQFQPGETHRSPRKGKFGKGGKPAILSPGSASFPRQSPRFKVKK